MTDEKRRIMDMFVEGRITEQEADLLLAQLEPEAERAASPEASVRRPGEPRMLRVRVVVFETGKPKPTHVNINLPLKVARVAGRMIQTMMPDEARRELAEQGMDLSSLDWNELIDALSETGGDIVNIAHEDGDDQVTVRVYVE